VKMRASIAAELTIVRPIYLAHAAGTQRRHDLIGSELLPHQGPRERLVPRLGHNKTIGVIAHRLCHLIWIILHNGVRYEERGPAVSKQSQQRHTARMIRKLRMLGYRVEPIGGPA